MRYSALILSIVGAVVANSCDTELPCDGPFAVNITALEKRNLIHVTSYKAWTAYPQGCWTDLSGNVRALDAIAGINGNSVTPESCIDACDAQGFNLAGVEWSRECFCGNTVIGNNRPTQDANCNFPCTGDETKVCGGSGTLNLYVKDNYPFTVGPATVLQSYNGYSKTQCWQDSRSNRILPECNVHVDGNSMTVQKCIDACAAAGYSSAGVEFGRECYCGNVNYPPGQSESMSECDMPCLGDASQFCGGRDRILIYYKPVSVTRVGVLKVTNSINGQDLGYVSKNPLIGSLYGYQPNLADALVVSFTFPNGLTLGQQTRITASNGITGFPLMGLIQGRDDTNSVLQAGSFHYAYVGGVNGVPAGSPPQPGPNSYSQVTGTARNFESDVWTIDVSTGYVWPVWINPDRTTPAVRVFGQSTAIYISGDSDAFLARYPAPITYLTLKFIAS